MAAQGGLITHPMAVPLRPRRHFHSVGGEATMTKNKNNPQDDSARTGAPKVGGIFCYRAFDKYYDDPRLRVIAKRVGVPRMVAVGTLTALLTHASRTDDRGSIEAFYIETCSVNDDLEVETVQALVKAFEEKGFTANGRFVDWDKDQVLREDSSTERVRNFRAAKKLEAKQSVASDEGGADETHVKRNVTPIEEKSIVDQSRSEHSMPLAGDDNYRKFRLCN
jgi:hypothetical protein